MMYLFGNCFATSLGLPPLAASYRNEPTISEVLGLGFLFPRADDINSMDYESAKRYLAIMREMEKSWKGYVEKARRTKEEAEELRMLSPWYRLKKRFCY